MRNRMLFLLVAMLCFGLHGFAAKYKTIWANAELHKNADFKSEIVCQLDYGVFVECDNDSIDKGWQYVHAEGQGVNGWILGKYLVKVLPNGKLDSDGQFNLSASNNMVRRGIILECHKKNAHQSRSVMTWIECLGFLLIILFLIASADFSFPLMYSMMFVNTILFLLELYHIVGFVGDVTWFYSPSQVGWLWSIINFVLSVIIVTIQALSFSICIEAANYHGGRDCSPNLGFVALAVGLVAWFLCGTFRTDLGMQICVWFIIGSQLLQLLYFVFANFNNGGSWINLFVVTGFYILGLIVILMDVAVVIPTLISAGFALFMGHIFDKYRVSPSSVADNGPSYIDIHHTAHGTPYYNGPDGHMQNLISSSTGQYTDEQGRTFDENGYRKN